MLLLGTTHFYVIEGVTISNHGDLVDMETAPDGYVLKFVVSCEFTSILF